jgi:predicted nucleic acid-binding Zn finger protein
MKTSDLPDGFRVFFYDEQSGDTVACPRDYRIEAVGRKQFLFFKDDIAYDVDLENSTCTCPDFLARRRGVGLCKHLRLGRSLLSRSRGS